MLADSHILNLSKVSLETRDLLPEYSGIYYVIEENNTVWYIGKAKNIRERWQGKGHHRIYQLKNQKQKHFSIYYEQVDFSQLDEREQQQIQKYHPHLNNSPVKSKKLRPTETLFRETIATISDFAFILGVESPRREVKDKIGIEWLINKKILDLPIIHICLDMNNFKEQFNIDSVNEYEALTIEPFKTRKAYANKWKGFPRESPILFRLLVNGYIIEVSFLNFWIEGKNTEKSREYNQLEIAGESIKVLTKESLKEIKNNLLENKNKRFQLQRLTPYKSDLIPLFFNEAIDLKTARQKLYKLSQDYKTGKRGPGSRSHYIGSKSIDSDFKTIEELLMSRGIDLNKYQNNNILRKGYKGRIELYLKCFNLNPKIPYSCGKNIGASRSFNYNAVAGILNNHKTTSVSSKFEIVYLLASVDLKAWLLVEDYLQDFATAFKQFNNGEGVTQKFYVSPRKFIVPAKVNIKLEKMQYNAWIPFGMSREYPTFEAAKEEIKTRLMKADLPYLKLSFKKESITK